MPLDRFVPLRRADAHDGGRNDLAGRNRRTQQGGNKNDRARRHLGSERVDCLYFEDARPDGLDNLEPAERNAKREAERRARDCPEGNRSRGTAEDADEDHHDADGFLRVVERVVERKKAHVEPLRIGKERMRAQTRAAGEEAQQNKDQKPDDEADDRGYEDHQNDFRPEVIPADGAGAEGRNARAYHAADKRVGRRSGDCEKPGCEIPEDGCDDARRDERQRDALCFGVGIAAFRYDFFNRVRNAGADGQNGKRGEHFHNRRPGKRGVRPHGTARNQRCNNVASVMKPVDIREDKCKGHQYPERDRHMRKDHPNRANVCGYA
ncbi:hypothetical protein SDC9_64596 [bioreactor metagenome]|uniref:Uncharacterized protein n=1 Tax=bioreactor metagenome TaxID=1076179 RepID=A0A644XPQ4_9ZZZZ